MTDGLPPPELLLFFFFFLTCGCTCDGCDGPAETETVCDPDCVNMILTFGIETGSWAATGGSVGGGLVGSWGSAGGVTVLAGVANKFHKPSVVTIAAVAMAV